MTAQREYIVEDWTVEHQRLVAREGILDPLTSRVLLPQTPQPATVGMSVMCPDLDCGQSAEVVDAWVWSSTDGPVPHARTRCRQGHVFTPPSDWLIPCDASPST